MLKKYRTTQVLRFHGGVLGLTEKQAGLRRHNLKPVGKDRYEVMDTVCFKAGEVIGLEQVDKHHAKHLEPVGGKAKAADDDI